MPGSGDRASSIKSAYELALEQLEQRGIERPREESLDEAARESIADLRRRAKAKLAELEILHRDRLRGLADPVERDKADQEYVAERRRIEEDRDRKIEAVRTSG